MNLWRKDFSKENVGIILEKIRKARIIGDDGSISFKAGDFENWFSILTSAINLEVKSDALRSQIIRSALSDPGLTEYFTESDFRGVVWRLHEEYQRKELTTYRVAFPIWNKPDFLQGARKINGVTLNFSPSHKTRVYRIITKEREKQRSIPSFSAFFTKDRVEDLQHCSICLASVRASSPADANEQASNALYQILGLVNLAANGGKYWRFSFRVNGTLPVSDVLIGPHTTTHFENGELTNNIFWHENWVGGPSRKSMSGESILKWGKRVQQLEQGISRSPWRDRCKTAAVRYYKAFSNPNLEESFLQGWRLFEAISGPRHDKIKDQILRASNIFENNKEYLIIGKHLQLRRNSLTHGHDINSDDDETVAFQMLQFVTPLLERYILNRFDFSSPEELWEFLDLPARRRDPRGNQIRE